MKEKDKTIHEFKPSITKESIFDSMDIYLKNNRKFDIVLGILCLSLSAPSFIFISYILSRTIIDDKLSVPAILIIITVYAFSIIIILLFIIKIKFFHLWKLIGYYFRFYPAILFGYYSKKILMKTDHMLIDGGSWLRKYNRIDYSSIKKIRKHDKTKFPPIITIYGYMFETLERYPFSYFEAATDNQYTVILKEPQHLKAAYYSKKTSKIVLDINDIKRFKKIVKNGGGLKSK